MNIWNNRSWCPMLLKEVDKAFDSDETQGREVAIWPRLCGNRIAPSEYILSSQDIRNERRDRRMRKKAQ